MRHLTSEEVEQFRTEYRDTEREVQKNIGFYLSALVVASGWILGPQAKSFDEMILGNGGRNIYAFLAIIGVNVAFSVFLSEKSIIIHEISQFIFHQAPDDNPVLNWEAWRRSKQSLSKRVRAMYTITIVTLPILVSAILLYVVWSYAWADPRTLATRIDAERALGIATHQTNIRVISPSPLPTSARTVPKQTHANQPGGPREQEVPAVPPVQLPAAPPTDVHALSTVLTDVRFWYKIVAVAHILPLWFFWVSARTGKEQWDKLFAQRPNVPRFLTLNEQFTDSSAADQKPPTP